MSEQKSEIPEAPEIVVEHLSREAVGRKLNELSRFRGKFVMDENFIEFKRQLESKYGNQVVGVCELLHFVVGSSIRPKDIKNTFFDFTGEDSIEKYLRDNYPEK